MGLQEVVVRVVGSCKLALPHTQAKPLTSCHAIAQLSKWSILERTARKEQNIPAVTFIR